jgi:hypothetical protein
MELTFIWSDVLGQFDIVAGSESGGASVLASWISNDVQACEGSVDTWVSNIRSADGYVGAGNTSTVWRAGDVVLIESEYVEGQNVLLETNQLIELLVAFRERLSGSFHDPGAAIPSLRVSIIATGTEAHGMYEQRSTLSRKG